MTRSQQLLRNGIFSRYAKVTLFCASTHAAVSARRVVLEPAIRDRRPSCRDRCRRGRSSSSPDTRAAARAPAMRRCSRRARDSATLKTPAHPHGHESPRSRRDRGRGIMPRYTRPLAFRPAYNARHGISPIPAPISEAALSEDDVEACVRVLRAIETDRSHLTRLTGTAARTPDLRGAGRKARAPRPGEDGQGFPARRARSSKRTRPQGVEQTGLRIQRARRVCAAVAPATETRRLWRDPAS